MNFFGRSQPSRVVHSALQEANGLWKRAAKSGARGLADAGDKAEDVWSEAKASARDAWQEAKQDAEQRFNDVLNKAEQSWKKGSLSRWDKVSRKPITALVVIGAALGLALLIASLQRPDASEY